MKTYPRAAAIFAPLFALRREDDLGIGDTESARQMIDACAALGFSILQILPINETADDNSPYNAISAMALEPSTLQITPPAVPGLLQRDINELAPPEHIASIRLGSVNYPAVKSLKLALLRRAYERLSSAKNKDWEHARNQWRAFDQCEADWLLPYTFFRLFLDRHQHKPYTQWPKEHASWQAAQNWIKALDDSKRRKIEREARFFSFVQWIAHTQWKELQHDGRARGVRLMGDMPFGISRFSADTWQRPELFDLTRFGGSPPEPLFCDDPFTRKFGQNWGISIYRWDQMEKENCRWFRERIRRIVEYFDLFRIDHILGFYRIYTFPWPPEENALYLNATPAQLKKKFGWLPRFDPASDDSKEGKKINKEQGEKLIKVVQKAAGKSIIIGEDLGMVPDYVRPSLAWLGISGFKIPRFERDKKSGEFLPPEDYPALSVTTPSTHDHITMAEYWEECWNLYLAGEEKRRAIQHPAAGRDHPHDQDHERFIHTATEASWEIYRMQRLARLDDRTMLRSYEPDVHWELMRRLCESNSWLVILGISDLLGLKVRFNVPGSVASSNWSTRLDFTIHELRESPRFENARQQIRSILKNARRTPNNAQ